MAPFVGRPGFSETLSELRAVYSLERQTTDIIQRGRLAAVVHTFPFLILRALSLVLLAICLACAAGLLVGVLLRLRHCRNCRARGIVAAVLATLVLCHATSLPAPWTAQDYAQHWHRVEHELNHSTSSARGARADGCPAL